MEIVAAAQEPERRCFHDVDVISYPWINPSPRVKAINDIAGDSLNLTSSLSSPLVDVKLVNMVFKWER